MENLKLYATSLNANSEIMSWLDTAGSAAIKKQKATSYDLEHIIDFLVSDRAPKRLQKLSVKDAKRLAKEWSDRNQKKGKNLVDTDGDIEVIHDFLDGTKIVQLKTKKAYEREGFLMSHCVGGYAISSDVAIYSYRDKNNDPHATFEVRRNNNEIVQIKGKGNGSIHPKYIHPILAFLQSIGIKIRSSEMQNLGYYHVNKDFMPFLSERGLDKRLVTIHNELYTY